MSKTWMDEHKPISQDQADITMDAVVCHLEKGRYDNAATALDRYNRSLQMAEVKAVPLDFHLSVRLAAQLADLARKVGDRA